jgi:hypothetical protein
MDERYAEIGRKLVEQASKGDAIAVWKILHRQNLPQDLWRFIDYLDQVTTIWNCNKLGCIW